MYNEPATLGDCIGQILLDKEQQVMPVIGCNPLLSITAGGTNAVSRPHQQKQQDAAIHDPDH